MIFLSIRWNNNQKHKSGSSEGLKMHRKNSNTMQHFPNFSTTPNNNNNNSNNQGMFYHHSNMNNNNNYNKSSSYPNFATSNTGVLTNNVLNTALNYNGSGPPPLFPPQTTTKNQQELQARDIQAVVNAFHESYRHSLTNLISMQQPLIMQQAVAQAVAEVAASQHDTTQNENLVSSSNASSSLSSAASQGSNSGGGQGNVANHDKNTSSIGDINSRLEFLCLQMTEQAIN